MLSIPVHSIIVKRSLLNNFYNSAKNKFLEKKSELSYDIFFYCNFPSPVFSLRLIWFDTVGPPVVSPVHALHTHHTHTVTNGRTVTTATRRCREVDIVVYGPISVGKSADRASQALFSQRLYVIDDSSPILVK